MTTPQASLLSRLHQSWPILGLFLAGLLICKGLTGRTALAPRAEAAVSTAQPVKPSRSFCPIEQIRVGQRVVTELADGILDIDGQPFDRSLPEGATRVDPATWRLVRMRAEDVWPDGTVDDINIETLQPLEWIKSHEVEVGRAAPIPLDLIEMGLPGDLVGIVTNIEHCPTVENGTGGVVLTTVDHLNTDVWALTFRDAEGAYDKCYPTGFHRFWSVTREAWVSAKELTPSDQLAANDRTATVVSIVATGNRQRVYNFTVSNRHVYRVSNAGILVHNNGCGYDMHHGTPRQAIDQAPPHIDPRDIRGTRGQPNRVRVDHQDHMDAHNGGFNGGTPRYNREYLDRIERIPVPERTAYDYWELRARMLWEYFGIEVPGFPQW